MSSSKNSTDGNIQIYLRIRPSKRSSGYFQIHERDESCTTLAVRLPDTFKSDYVNNTKLKYDYTFNGILPMECDQEAVFKRVGQEAVQNALDGFNSTIFAYGQTGSGKTFTITGGPEKYSDRGIIPRAINMVFRNFRKRTDVQLKTYISYLEIYNEQGYDLLDEAHEKLALENLPKVHMLEDEYGNFHLKNLSMHVANSEEDALNLLFMGDTNRAIAETPMNMASSRSHCIFTISLEVRENGSDLVRRSKLHLVDLAGSERIAKTNSKGDILKEAISINGSLFFLEMVIVALHEKATKGRTHVPYRNSMMTSILRDSLGGNCKTIMIATINPEASHTDESLSTCRFAQRVALIKNKAVVNEDVDPSVVIGKLKDENLNLREEIGFLKGEAGEGDALTPKELDNLASSIKEYVHNCDKEAILNIGKLTLTKIKTAFGIFKSLVSYSNGRDAIIAGSDSFPDLKVDSSDEVAALKSCLLQRDNEIAILVNMIKKGKTIDDVSIARVRSAESNEEIISVGPNIFHENFNETSRSCGSVSGRKRESKQSYVYEGTQRMYNERDMKLQDTIVEKYLFGIPPPEDKSLFDDPAVCFEWFRDRSSLSNNMSEDIELLKKKYEEARLLGDRANKSRNTIQYLKNSIESIRRERALRGLVERENSGNDIEDNPEEETYRSAIEQEKAIYKENFETLRVLKPEIEHLRKMLEKSRATLQAQFDQWFNALHHRNGEVLSSGSATQRSGPNTSAQMLHKAESKTKEADQYYGVRISKESKEHSKVAVSDKNSLKNNINTNRSCSEEVNDDILAFYHAKEELLKRRGQCSG